MNCPYCGSEDLMVRDSRPVENGGAVRRRRLCQVCAARFTTLERVHMRPLVVLKRDGRKIGFDRDKLVRSVRIALRKRPISEEQFEKMISGVVRRLEARGDSEIASKDIGMMVMEALRRRDQIGYIRYASVYEDFSDTADFVRVIQSLEHDDRSE